jgi:hypothetical protein
MVRTPTTSASNVWQTPWETCFVKFGNKLRDPPEFSQAGFAHFSIFFFQKKKVAALLTNE